MGKADLPYTYCSRKRLKSGIREYWRFRRDGIDTPLPGNPRKDHAAMRRYADLIEAAEAREKQAEGPARHSFEWLARQYLASAEFSQLAAATQLDYTKVIENRLLPLLGEERFDAITRGTVKIVRDGVIKAGLSARTANKVKQLVSLLYSWADESDLLPENFANPGKRLRKIKGAGKPIEIWSDEEVALFLARCEPFMRTAVLLALHTGQRACDLVAMEWTDYQASKGKPASIRVRQNKTGEPLTIPCHPALRKHLDSIRTRFGGPIVRGHNGKPTNANALQSAVHRAVAKIDGMPSRSLHGLRYAAAGRLEAAGCTVVQISAIVGHRTYQMAMKYARQRRDAEAAIARLAK